jgi:hypothetical protein
MKGGGEGKDSRKKTFLELVSATFFGESHHWWTGYVFGFAISPPFNRNYIVVIYLPSPPPHVKMIKKSFFFIPGSFHNVP